MIAGHFGFAALAKSREPRVPLWSLMLATVWLDIIFVPLFVMKLETLEPVPGLRGGYGQNIIHADYTHSLLGALVLSLIFGLAFGVRWGRRCALVLAFVASPIGCLIWSPTVMTCPCCPGILAIFPDLDSVYGSSEQARY